MRRLNEVMDLKFSLLIFGQFHGAITRSQKKCLRTFVRQYLGNNFHELPTVISSKTYEYDPFLVYQIALYMCIADHDGAEP